MMVKRGFDAVDARLDSTVTNADLHQSEQRLHTQMQAGFRHVSSRLALVREGIAGLPTIREALYDLWERLDHLERKVGVKR
jgi:hypothetical protein